MLGNFGGEDGKMRERIGIAGANTARLLWGHIDMIHICFFCVG